MDVGHARRFVSQARFKGENGLFPFRVEEVLNEEKRLEASMRQFDGDLIPFGKIEVDPRG